VPCSFLISATPLGTFSASVVLGVAWTLNSPCLIISCITMYDFLQLVVVELGFSKWVLDTAWRDQWTVHGRCLHQG
jgi:hypothetical protein